MPPLIYTKTGDQGDTSLACGSRIPKDDLRIEAYGTMDELSSVLGVVSAMLEKLGKKAPYKGVFDAHMELIDWMQDKLFTLSSMIATANLPAGSMPVVSEEDVLFLERHIDEMERELPELRNFILPGGSELVSFIHLARTVCRRSERVCTGLNRESALNPVILPFLNRLSDELFVFSRWVGFKTGETEKIWMGRKPPEPKTGRIIPREKLSEKLAKKLLHDEFDMDQLSLFSESPKPNA